ncbi:MAG: dienelactone hydrolase family protein [Polymorphobacter sp.]
MITQSMIDLYDRFTHRDLDRRALMSGLARLAGGTAAAAALLPLIEASASAAGLTPDNDPRVVAQMLEWPGANGHIMRGYHARPANSSKRLPAIMVIHENRGLNAHTKDVARRMALEGFDVLAPDFLSPSGGTPVAADATPESITAAEDKARTMIGALDRAATIADAVATLAFHKSLKSTTGKAGAVGFCWGGGMVNALAIAAGDALKAGVAYYGPVPADLTQVGKIRAAMLLHYAGLDERINTGIVGYEAALKAAGVTYAAFVYDGVNHAFNNDTSAARYNKPAADLASARTIDWLKKYVR